MITYVDIRNHPVAMFSQYQIDKSILRIGVFRFASTPTYTMGCMYLNGDPFCFTLEDPVRDINKDGDLDDPGEQKIYGETAIPSGTYKVVLYNSPTFKRVVPLIKDVKGFSGILIHGGNSVKDTKGCILVASNAFMSTNKIQGTTEKDLVRIMGRYKETYIQIVDGQSQQGIELTVSV